MVDGATSDEAWLQALLDVEAALAFAAARVGLIPLGAAAAIGAACKAELFDMAEIARGAAADATPVVALVRSLRGLVPDEVRPCVHLGATSQDIMDTAMSLIAKRALVHVMELSARVANALAALASEHRDTPQVGRTLLQHAALTTFGAACAGRLVAIDEASTLVARVWRERLAVQLGGAVGTLVPAGPRGPQLITEFAAILELTEPTVPWHTARGRIAELATALGVLAGELAAVAQDLVLLSATEVGEVSSAGPGGSSAMPHKKNPAAAVLAIACAHRVPALVATVLAGMPQGLQRSAGHWQAEWGTVRDEIRLVGGTSRHTVNALDGLRVHPDRMAQHVDELRAAAGEGAIATGSAQVFVDQALAAHEVHVTARLRE